MINCAGVIYFLSFLIFLSDWNIPFGILYRVDLVDINAFNLFYIMIFHLLIVS